MERVADNTKVKRGQAKFRRGNGKVLIIFKEDRSTFEFDLDECPTFCKSIPNGVYNVSVGSDGIIGMNPWIGGPYKHKLVRILPARGADKDDPPGFTDKEGKYGKYRTFMVLFQIVKGDYKGMNAVKTYIDKFRDNNGLTGVALEGEAAAAVWQLLEVTGVSEKKIPYDEKLLSRLNGLMLKAGAEFEGMYKDGWLNSLDESLDDDDGDEDWGDGPDEEVLDKKSDEEESDDDWDKDDEDAPPF